MTEPTLEEEFIDTQKLFNWTKKDPSGYVYMCNSC